MVGKETISYRRRQTDWQTQTFRTVGLPPLAFADLETASFAVAEVLKPRFEEISKRTRRGDLCLNEKQGIAIFHEALDNKVGVALENAAAELLLTSMHDGQESDWVRFTGWVARRTQPLDPKLIDAFGRFYVCRLNNVLTRVRLPAARLAANSYHL